MEYSPKNMFNLLNKYKFNLKKNFGQNFIIDENIINNIIKKSDINKDVMVLEVGPGAGSLTYKLALSSKNVLAYEIDNKVKPILDENLSDLNNVEIIYNDFLKSDVKNQLKKYNYKKLYLVANLPYYITTPIIIKVIEDELDIEKIVVMVQKEVGDRFKAKPGSKNYNSLSIFLNYYYNIEKIIDVSRNVFMPKPNVDSIVIQMTRKENLLYLKNKKLFFKLIKDSFSQKRKTIKNNLKNYDLLKIESILKKHNMDLTVRAEMISMEIFVEIANSLGK